MLVVVVVEGVILEVVEDVVAEIDIKIKFNGYLFTEK